MGKYDLIKMLCEELDMDFVLDTERTFYIRNGMVCSSENGGEHIYDERVNLFVALRNLIVYTCPNCECRSEKHIFNYEH